MKAQCQTLPRNALARLRGSSAGATGTPKAKLSQKIHKFLKEDEFKSHSSIDSLFKALDPIAERKRISVPCL